MSALVNDISISGSYKMQKAQLQDEGYDVNKILDDIYVFSCDKYILMDTNLHAKIVSGQLKL